MPASSVMVEPLVMFCSESSCTVPLVLAVFAVVSLNGLYALAFRSRIASSMVFLPVPPMLLIVKLPSSPTAALPPNTPLTVLAVLPKTFCTAYSWLPLMASVDVLEISPGATFFN